MPSDANRRGDRSLWGFTAFLLGYECGNFNTTALHFHRPTLHNNCIQDCVSPRNPALDHLRGFPPVALSFTYPSHFYFFQVS